MNNVGASQELITAPYFSGRRGGYKMEFDKPEVPKPSDPAVKKTRSTIPMTAWFLGPKAENADLWRTCIEYIFTDYTHWRRNYFPQDPVVITRERRRDHELWTDQLNNHLDRLLSDLKSHFPFYSPRYIAHMLSEQTLPSIAGYFAGMLYNPNNVTSEAAPVTVEMELEVGRAVSEMLGFNSRTSWAHICSGGTIANIEALWAARVAQFYPFCLRDYCTTKALTFLIKLPNGTQVPLKDASDAQLISLRPNEAILMGRKLADFLVKSHYDPKRVGEELGKAINASEYNIVHRGLSKVVHRISMRPVIYVSAAAHYSIKKAAAVLGYGEDSVIEIPTDSSFRIDVRELRNKLTSLGKDQYVASVVGIVGTTEEGAVDPVHDLHFLRQELAREHCRYFWLHVDAAWGGYIRTLFCGHRLEGKRDKKLETLANQYAEVICAREDCKLPFQSGDIPVGQIRWDNSWILMAFLAMQSADSITVDPHKLGFVPYPAGIVAFKNGAITDLLAQRAQYISEEQGGYEALTEPKAINAIGPYILEGSKPGAAAASCWLAHKTIPLTVSGHGKMMRTSLLNARKLVKYMVQHRHNFMRFHCEVYGASATMPTHCFAFEPLYEPQTNIVCFVVRPMFLSNRTLKPRDADLKELNSLNRLVYDKLSISTEDHFRTSYSQPFFVSRTILRSSQYHGAGIARLLAELGITVSDYMEDELFVLRCTVMNPMYFEAYRQAKIDYLFEFVKHLHFVTHETLGAKS